MKRSIIRLLVSAALFVASAQAALAQQPTPPEHFTLDPRGVDQVQGTFNHTAIDVVIGQPGQGGIVHGRAWVNGGWRDLLSGTIAVSGSTYVVSLGAESEAFTLSGSTFTPVSNNGSSLTQSGTTLTFTTSSGTVATYSTTYSGSVMAYQANNAALTSVRSPNGDLVTYNWDGITYCRTRDRQTGQCLVYGNATRLNSVTSSRGYQVNFTYATNVPPDAPIPPGASWLRRTGALGINLAVDYCGPQAQGCTGLTRTWPSVTYATTQPYGNNINSVTDQSGRVTTYSYTSGRLTGVRLPGSPSDDVQIAYNTDAPPKVSGVTDASGAWTYAYSDAGGNRTTVASGPENQQTTVVANLSIGRATSATQVTSVSPPASSTWSYQYDGQRRLNRVTNPEGDYSQLTYDGRGNVTQVTAVPKAGSGLSTIVTSTTYPATCSNPVTCNLPTSTTDARGNTTNYTWDSTHGGPLTVTLPAPASGADRPQTRYGYSSFYAWYKNSGGTIVQASTPVTLPTTVSACATGTSCANAANEVRTTVEYGATGVANNLLPTLVSRGSGASPAMEVVATTWTPNGDVETLDGPLAGADDTTRYRYDEARRLVGTVGPDPDAGGALLNRAQRMTYNLRGQVTLTEVGTTPGYTDPNWASFNPLLGAAVVYDGPGRLIEVRQQDGAGAVSGIQQVSYDAAGRRSCIAVRMNPATFGSLPGSACAAATAGSDGPDSIVQTTYDTAGRLLTTTSAYGLSEATTESVTWTANGLPGSLTDGNSNVSVLEYDGFDRLARSRYPNATGGGTSTTDYEDYTYDTAGNVVTSRNRAGQTTSYTWDALNRLTAVDAPAGTQDAEYGYDNLGRKTSLAIPSVQFITTAWDALGRQTSEYSPTFGTVGFQYDAAGRTTRITWPDAFYVAYDHDLYGAVTAVRENGAMSGAGVLATWGYDNLGQLTDVTRGNGVTSSYGYNAFARMTSMAHNPAGTADDVTLGFGYSSAGQITNRTVSDADYVFAPVIGSTGYQLNGLNQVTTFGSAPVAYDANRNLTTGTGHTYGYDAANRLRTATNSATATFLYDANDRLLSSSGVGPTRYFLYAGDQAIAEYDDTGAVTNRYIPGLGLNDVVVSYDGAGISNRNWLLADERGSVMALTNDAGAVSAINRYDEYGVPASGNTGRFQYTGQAWLAEAGAYHYRARTYLPQIGRFLQTDPIGYAAGANLYAYVGGDPVNSVDPLGLNPDIVCTVTVVYRRNADRQIVPVSQSEPDCDGNGDTARPRPVFGGFHPGIFGSGPGIGSYFGGGGSGRGPVMNDPAYAPFRAEVAAESARNAWMAEPILLVMPTGHIGRLGRLGGVFSKVCNCFVAGTDVLTSEGTRDIETIQVGDLVLSRDDVTGETGFRPVVALIDGAERQIWEVTVETVDAEGAARRETFGTTDEHPWRLVGGDWAETAELYPGAELVTADGRRAVVVSVARTDRVEQTFNFEVGDSHTYFVGESGLWVHNACDPSRLTYLYQKVGVLGQHLKIGITSNPLTRYTRSQLAGGRLRIVASGRRDEMLALERHLHRTLPRGREDGRGL